MVRSVRSFVIRVASTAVPLAVVGAQTTWLVGGGGLPDINAAMAVASPGDVVRVAPGIYPPFTVTKTVSILPTATGGTWTIQAGGAPAPAMYVGATAVGTRTVTVVGMRTDYKSLLLPAVIVQNAPTTVVIDDLRVNYVTSLVNSQAPSAVYVENSQVWLRDAAIAPTVAGVVASTLYVAPPPIGGNDGLCGIYAIGSRLRVQNVLVFGFDAAGAYGGDAVRLDAGSSFYGDGVSITALAFDLRGGAGGVFGGNALHYVMPTSMPLSCSTINPVGGAAPNPGGAYAINGDRGFIAPGVQRFVPSCLGVDAGFTNANTRNPALGTTLNITTTALVNRGYSLFLSFGATVGTNIPGIAQRSIVDLPTAVLIGSATTPATIPLTVPNTATLLGVQYTLQGVLAPTANSGPAFTSGDAGVIG